jgi:DNA helicase TIP49 (TBP-interacting protein)
MIKIKDDLSEVVITITDRVFYETLVSAAKQVALRYSVQDIQCVARQNKKEITLTEALDIREALEEFGDEFE